MANEFVVKNGLIVSGSTSIISGSTLSIGATVTLSEANLFLGPNGTGEGGQIILQSGTSFSSASMLDTYGSLGQEYFRILRGNNTSSNAIVSQFDLHTRQFFLPAYTGSGTFPGTAAAYLAVTSAGDVITSTGTAGA